MRQFFLMILAVGFTGVSYSQSNVLEIQGIRYLSIDTNVRDLEFIKSDKEELIYSGSNECIDMLKFEYSNRTLVLGFDQNDNITPLTFAMNTCKVEYQLHYITLDEIYLESGARINGDLYNEESKLNLEINYASSVDLNLVDLDSLDLTMNGNAEVKLSGNLNHLAGNFHDAISLDAQDIDLNSASISATRAVTIYIRPTETLEVTSKGASRVFYYGNPIITNQDIEYPENLIKSNR